MLAGEAAIVAAIAAIVCGTLWLRAERRLRLCFLALSESEKSRARAAATASEAQQHAVKLRLVLDLLPMPVWRRAADHRLIDCNREYARALGGDRDIILAEQSELISPHRAVPGGSAQNAATKTPIVIGGQRRLLEIVELSCADGETVGFGVDLTEVENAERELRRHIGAHAAVLEILSAAVAIFGPDKRLKFFNSAFNTLWALDQSWLGAEPTVGEILEHLHESRRFPEYSDFQAFKRERCALFTSLIEPRHELMHLPDGRTLQLTIAPHPFGGLIYVFDNVTDRLALECSYNTLSQVQRASLDHLFEGIAVYGGDGRLKLHNPAFRTLWGLSEADVAGEPHIAEIAEKVRHLLDDGGGDWAARRGDMVAQVTNQSFASGPLYRRDGSVLQVASVPLPDGEVLLTYLDVSDTARIEQALRERNDALETAARLKSEFVANVSHELRTPLNTVAGFAEILHNQYFGPLNSSQREYSAGILDGAQQLTTLINDVIDLASIEANYLELERSRVDIHDMLQTILLLIRERAHNRGIKLQLGCPPQIGAIIGDERRLKQALFNLISNAVKFTPPGSIVRISAERHQSELLLSVCDSATGFAMPQIARFSGRMGGCRGQPHSALGLSLVKSLIELHGGQVEIEGAPGDGTKIICRLPVGDGDAGRREPIFAKKPGPVPDDSACDAVA